jgi:hypothetical protein
VPQLASAELRDLETGYRSSDDTLMRLARRSMKAFFSYVMRDEQTGAPVEFAPIHETWHRLADQYDRLMLWAAMESGKTQSLSVARTLWELGRDPTLRFAIISNTSGMAVKIANQIGKYITQSEELHRVFPHLEPDPTMPWNSEQLTVKRPTLSKDPSVNTLGIGSNTQGARIDRAVLDDVLNRENTRTQYMRDESQDWYLKTIPGRMTERGRILGVGNAWNPDDLYHRLVKNPRWKGYKFPILKADGTSAWPTVWPLDRIERRRQELGPMESMSQLMCQPIDDAMSRFKREWIETCLRRGEGKDVVYALRGIPFGCKLYCGVDLAVGRKEHHDRTAFFVLLIHPNGDRQVLWVESGRMLATDIMEKVKDLSLRFGGIFVIENVACFPPDQVVLTQTGYREIAGVQVGDLVMTHMGRWRPVLEVTHRPFVGDLTVVDARGAPSVRCTPTHAFWVRNSGRVLGPREGKDVGKHRPVGAPGWQSATLLQGGKNGNAHYVCTPIARWPFRQAMLNLWNRGKRRRLRVNTDLAIFLGLYVAEGSASDAVDQVNLTLNENEQHIVDHAKKVASGVFRANCYETFRPKEHSRRIAINSVAARKLCVVIGKSSKKCLPWGWMGWPLRTRLAIVRGWLMGDGCLRLSHAGTKWPVVLLSGETISRAWATQARMSLLEAGYHPTLCRVSLGQRKGTSINGRVITRRHDSWHIALNAEETEKFLRSCTTDVERSHWGERINRLPKAHEPLTASRTTIVIEEGFAWSKVHKVGNESYEGEVYNLVVGEDHSYVAGDMAVHNCQDYLVQILQGSTAIPIVPFATGKNKADPTFGLEAMAAEFAAGKWIIPNRGGVCHPEVQEWVNEMLGYNPAAHSGDRLMAAWFAKEGERLSVPVAKPYCGTVRLKLNPL